MDMQRPQSWCKAAPHAGFTVTVTALAFAALVVIESKAAMAALAIATGPTISTLWGDLPIAGLQAAALSAIFGTLALFAFVTASSRADDDRPHIRKSALGFRVFALCLLVVPTWNLATSFAKQRQDAEWQAFYGSDAYLAARELAADRMADSRERAEAELRITPPGVPQPGFFDLLGAIFAHALVAMLGGLRLPRKESPAERAERLRAAEEAALKEKRQEAARKAAATRAAKKKEAAKAARKPLTAILGGRA